MPRRRIIPALAGNTWVVGFTVHPREDHPRSRGEYPSAPGTPTGMSGSSPLSRGIPNPRGYCHSHPRIIPALAGNTARRRRRGRVEGDHPRSRGEYSTLVSSSANLAGSSPLSRGIPSFQEWKRSSPRIIPALAGTTATSPTGCAPGYGSSPLSRGIHGGPVLAPA